MAQRWFEVRIREQTGPFKWEKKSKFYRARNPKDAARSYRGPGNIMWVSKVSQERVFGIGDYFRLGPQLMAEIGGEKPRDRGFFRLGGDLLEQLGEGKSGDRHKNKGGG